MSTSTPRRLALTSVAILAAVGATVGVAGSAGAADSDTTTTTFTLQAGSLAISAPAAADLGTYAVGSSTVSGALGPVSVDDGRGALLANWVANVSSTNFTTGSAGSAETIAKEGVTYLAGTASASSGTGLFAPGASGTLGLPLPAYTYAGAGANSVTWNPTITLLVPVGKVAGTYTGTITHSVS